MKKFAMLLSLLLAFSLLAGCAGTVVVVNECTCPGDHGTATPTTPVTTDPAPTTPTVPVAGDGALRTGLAIVATADGSNAALADTEGNAKFDATVAAVTLDEHGVIVACVIDGLGATVTFNAEVALTSDITAAPLTKNELGADYGMVTWGGAVAEWDQQVKALCDFAVGKTVEELKNGAVDQSGYAPDGSDLATSATIYLGGYVAAIEKAALSAKSLGAKNGDSLRIATVNSLASSIAATEDADGAAQLDMSVTAITVDEAGVVTSCIIDELSAKLTFNPEDGYTTDPTSIFLTKSELGADYGMVAWGGAKAEWNEQAAAFAAYVTGKTASEIAGIAISESTKPADGSDLATSVTISIGGFQNLLAKALG